jgi:hypothetical protein
MVMDSKILAVLARKLEPRFPDARASIDRLLVNDTFRDMCSDYEECSKSFQHWADRDRLRAGEYEQLLTDLLQEIASYLEDH